VSCDNMQNTKNHFLWASINRYLQIELLLVAPSGTLNFLNQTQFLMLLLCWWLTYRRHINDTTAVCSCFVICHCFCMHTVFGGIKLRLKNTLETLTCCKFQSNLSLGPLMFIDPRNSSSVIARDHYTGRSFYVVVVVDDNGEWCWWYW